jgi:1-acyl-sn-glycerol-3-phosphate acyltransferase
MIEKSHPPTGANFFPGNHPTDYTAASGLVRHHWTSSLPYLFKGSLAFLHIFIGLLLSVAIILPALWLWRAENLRNRIVLAWFRLFLRILAVRPKVSGEIASPPVLLVANHLGWLDILVLSSTLSASFVSKAEVRRWPVIGWLCASADTVFVERGNRGSAEQTTREIVHTLQRGRSVAVFPEGTSTDGNCIKPFRRRLFRAALAAGRPVQAVALFYPKDGHSNPTACYTGQDTMWRSFLRLLAEREVEVRLAFAEPLDTQGMAGDPHADTALARRTQEQVEEALARMKEG